MPFGPIITHLVLIHKDTPDYVEKLANNSKIISDCYERLFIGERKYYVIFVVSDSSGLTEYCESIGDKLKLADINVRVVKANMDALEPYKAAFKKNYLMGKSGLAHINRYYCGSILLNDIPISKRQAEVLLRYASQNWYNYKHYNVIPDECDLVLFKKGWFNHEFGIGLISTKNKFFDLLYGKASRYPNDQYTVTDIIRVMKANCNKREYKSLSLDYMFEKFPF